MIQTFHRLRAALLTVVLLGGSAGNVVGTASGEAAGNALRWRYVLALNVDGKTINVDFDDWMFLVDDQVMLNRSLMSKYGIALGEVTLSLRRRTP